MGMLLPPPDQVPHLPSIHNMLRATAPHQPVPLEHSYGFQTTTALGGYWWAVQHLNAASPEDARWAWSCSHPTRSRTCHTHRIRQSEEEKCVQRSSIRLKLGWAPATHPPTLTQNQIHGFHTSDFGCWSMRPPPTPYQPAPTTGYEPSRRREARERQHVTSPSTSARRCLMSGPA